MSSSTAAPKLTDYQKTKKKYHYSRLAHQQLPPNQDQNQNDNDNDNYNHNQQIEQESFQLNPPHSALHHLLHSYCKWFIITFISILLIWITSTHHRLGSNPTTRKSHHLFHPSHDRKPSYLVSGKNGVVVSEEGRCSKIGVQVLKENGTATDAAIATALCIGVVNSFASGIGGGGFMIIKPGHCRNNSVQNCTNYSRLPISIDFRETVPDGKYYSSQFASDPSKSQIGGLSIGIPGELAGFQEAFDRFGGGVSWRRIFEPSIELAKNFSVGHMLARKLSPPGIRRWMDTKTEWSSVFLQPNQRYSRLGDWIQRPTYARTLEIISQEGIHPFYRGSIAEQLVHTINLQGGKVNLHDFKNYRAIVNPAINTTYHQYNIWTTGAPSSGPMLLHAMNILERYSLHHHPRTELAEHRFIEALKYSFSARTELGDPKFLNQTQLNRIELIQSKSYGHEISLKINDSKTFNYSHYQPKYDIVEDHGTTHLSVIDRFGSVVSLTSTVNLDFGSNVMDPVTGIILNDENDDFSIKGRSNYFDLFSSPLNYPVTGKRPISSMAPIIVDQLITSRLNPKSTHNVHSDKDDHENDDDGHYEFFATIGASGGSRIFSSIIGTFLKLLWGYDISHSIEDPRLHHQLLPNLVYVESSYRPDFLDSLKSKGHNISFIDIYTGKAAVHGIHRRDELQSGKQGMEKIYFGSSDSRKYGVPDAY